MSEIQGRDLQLLRVRIGAKAKEVAAKIGVSQSYYSEIETGKKPVPSGGDFLRRFVDAINAADTMVEAARAGIGTQEVEETEEKTAAKMKAVILAHQSPEAILAALLGKRPAPSPFPAPSEDAEPAKSLGGVADWVEAELARNLFMGGNERKRDFLAAFETADDHGKLAMIKLMKKEAERLEHAAEVFRAALERRMREVE